MKKFNSDLSINPSFNSITELTNTTFNPTNYVENRMATEEQISQLYNRIVENEVRRDKCCRDIIIWEAHTQIVRMNTVNIAPTTNVLTGGGVVVSTFDENVSIGTMRRGLSYTVTFPVKWDSNLYVARNIAASSVNSCIREESNNTTRNYNRKIINYRIVENNSIGIAECQSSSSNYARFWYGLGANVSTSVNDNVMGHLINSENNWGSFVNDIKDDGTVTITDHRRNTNFNIIRFYTQWVLRRTADNQLIPDPE